MMLRGLIEHFALIIESCKREIKMIFKDSAIVITYIVCVLLVAFVYSYVYSKEVITELPVAIVNQDQSKMSFQIDRMLDATPQLKVDLRTASMDLAQEAFYQEKIKGIIVIPEHFGRDLQKGKVPTLGAYCDASYMLYYKQTLGAVMVTAGTLGGQVKVNKMMAGGMPMKQAAATRRPFDVTAKPLFNINGGYATFLMPAVFLIAIQTLQLNGMGILAGTLREKRKFGQAFAYATGRFSNFFLTIGRSLAYLILSMLMMWLVLAVVMHLFTFPQRGNLVEVTLFLIPFLLAVSFLGMTLANCFKHREDSIMTITLFSIPTLLMTGLSWPTTAFPTAIKVVSFFVPSTIGTKGFVALTQFGASLQDVSDLFMQMWLVCLFYFMLAVWTNWRLRRKEGEIPSQER
ncbi:ABC transporter permease [Myroides sp. 1354]|uniref:ABC transporter permease n=1 Tax=unclassified Myroides TaxID=2642485 RepID=UPI002575DC9D|nr:MULTISPECIES: ABC transporter permease [unclassified Myroides]MDM1045229.1 ABC transporter permease [Myroides sp. R163-1]MDM1056111.1 ABC transporter permease [Myroides sp. 1354]MDM1069240.1 ABC transporter permease [Myroides sp. 1372]